MPDTRATLTARSLPTDELPSEFLVFRYGVNSNANSEAKGQPQPVFTKRSAEKLMADATRRGAAYPIDLEHRSVDPEAKRASADATDAMGWAKLDLRPDGLYALVKWTPEGERRLRAKSQIHTSPCFFFDAETGEITEFVNVALVSDPATYGAQALVAAGRKPAPKRVASPAQLRAARRKVIIHESLTSPLTVKLTASAQAALCLAALRRGVTLAQFTRDLIAAAAYAPDIGPDQPLTPADLADMLSLEPGARDIDILDAVLALLKAADDASPANAPPPKAKPAAPKEPPLSPAVAAKVAAMDPVQRDRFERMRATMRAKRGGV